MILLAQGGEKICDKFQNPACVKLEFCFLSFFLTRRGEDF